MDMIVNYLDYKNSLSRNYMIRKLERESIYEVEFYKIMR